MASKNEYDAGPPASATDGIQTVFTRVASLASDRARRTLKPRTPLSVDVSHETTAPPEASARSTRRAPNSAGNPGSNCAAQE
jgi:hypothetical protein